MTSEPHGVTASLPEFSSLSYHKLHIQRPHLKVGLGSSTHLLCWSKEMSRCSRDTSLFARLRKAQVGCTLNGEQKFLPLDILEREITEDNVRGTLSKDSGFTATALKFLHLSNDNQLPGRVVDRARRVFAILVLIGEADAIKPLLDDGLTDDQLPLRLDDEGSTPISRSGLALNSFAMMSEQRVIDFVDKQWTVLAPVFDASGQHAELDRRCPLPFEDTEQTGHESTRAIYKTKLHPAHYFGPNLFESMDHVATKEFFNDKAFQHEKDNLKTLAALSHKHLIKHLATFTRHTKHFVIFPWANGGTLANLWLNQDTRTKDNRFIIWCLQQMLGISEAIQALHTVNCRHGDVKPENILHFTGTGEGILVVADVGVSKTHEKATLARTGLGTETRATTPSYEAPEAFMKSCSPRARRFDMWSVGCIFLEWALWILHDMQAINTFHDARHQPYYEFYLLNRGSSESPRIPVIHPIVSRAFELLRSDPRCANGTIFQNFIIFIEARLLQVEVEQRAGADELVDMMRSIVSDAEKDPARLLNEVDHVPDKLRFPRRIQTGAFEPAVGPIPE
jgi:serine/threonine protein kinase